MPDVAAPAIPDILQKWRSEGQTVDLLGKQIWYHDQGPKTDDAVFIVHGYPGSSWDFQGVVERIGPDTRTVVMDMRGFGLSEKPLEGNYQENASPPGRPLRGARTPSRAKDRDPRGP